MRGVPRFIICTGCKVFSLRRNKTSARIKICRDSRVVCFCCCFNGEMSVINWQELYLCTAKLNTIRLKCLSGRPACQFVPQYKLIIISIDLVALTYLVLFYYCTFWDTLYYLGHHLYIYGRRRWLTFNGALFLKKRTDT